MTTPDPVGEPTNLTSPEALGRHRQGHRDDPTTHLGACWCCCWDCELPYRNVLANDHDANIRSVFS